MTEEEDKETCRKDTGCEGMPETETSDMEPAQRETCRGDRQKTTTGKHGNSNKKEKKTKQS